MTRKLHRRHFLKLLGTGAALLPAANGMLALAGGLLPARSRVLLSPSATDLEAELLRTIRNNLEPLFVDREMALDFRRIDDEGIENFRIQINADEIYPVASSFKSFAVLYYFARTPRDEWRFTPDDSVYRVAVFSNNSETGRLLYEMGERVPGDGNAIEKFNDFLLDSLGLEYGLFSWNWQGAPTAGMRDDRFFPDESRWPEVHGRTEQIGNISTATDLANGYDFIIRAAENPDWQDPELQEAVRITRELLAVTAPNYRSPIEQVLFSGYIGKDGTMPAGELQLGRVINDAGIIRVPTGQFILSFMSAGENESSTKPALQTVVDSMRLYEEQMHPSGVTFMTGASHAVYRGRYNYGFVRYQNIPLYSAPSLDAPRVDNPVRRNTIFGLMYVMQGALLRFIPHDDEWGVVIRDDELDDTFSFDDWTAGLTEANWMAQRPERVYVRLEDLLIIGYEHSRPLGYVTDAPEGTEKFIIMDVPRRQLTLFEGATAILKTPVVLNMDQTPRGRLYVHRVYMTRNMPRYPGVPYTNFLHDGGTLNDIGYAIHGAPWHRWSETVTRRETLRRYSAGCINVPNWTLKIGRFTMPVDEFVFRWIGGFPRPGRDLLHLPSENIVRVYSHNNPYEEIYRYPPPDSVRLRGYDWDDILLSWDQKAVDAIDSFFEPTLL